MVFFRIKICGIIYSYMSHVLKVIIGFTFMIALGMISLYFINQQNISGAQGLNPVNAGAGCASKGEC